MDAPAPTSEAHEPKETLLETLARLGPAAFEPSVADREAAQHELSELLQRTRTVALLPALNVLIQPGRLPDATRRELTSRLALLPLRDDGVRATLEFVFSVHPSSVPAGGAAEAAAPQTQGAVITHEALKMATQLLASPPLRATAYSWFQGIAGQLMALLDGRDGLELAKVAAYVIGFGILGRKSFGAPGTPGWLSFAEPMLRCIDPTTSQRPAAPNSTGEAVVDLRKNAVSVLVSSDDVAQGLRRLQTLVISHPNPGLTRRLLHPIVLPLWALATWPRASKACEEDYSLPARNLLKIYLKITTAPDRVLPIVRNLLFDGSRDPAKTPQWAYQAQDARGDGICIVSAPSTPPDAAELLQTRWDEIGPKADALVELLESVATDDEDIASVFLDLFGRWLASQTPGQRTTAKDGILIREDAGDVQDVGDGNSPLTAVFGGSILQKMMQRFPERLVGRPNHILELVEGLLRRRDSTPLPAEDETTPVLLSLLNLVVTSPGFRRRDADAAVLQSIEASLGDLSQAPAGGPADSTAQTARNLLLLLKYRDELDGPATDGAPVGSASAANQKQAEERKTYHLAMSYITQADSPPPVRSEGLNLLQGLIEANSSILDIPAVLALLSSLLDENEDYVNLRVIKMFSVVADKHPKSTTRELLDHYTDAPETKSVDARLRFGEALLQVVQRLGATFAGDTAQQVGQALLETAGRRGHRPKTAAKQAREERMRALKDKAEAAKAAKAANAANVTQGGAGAESDSLDLDLDEALLSEEDRKRNAILGRIVEGWGSQRGSEDVRIRASALSILATAMDVNVAGLGAALASGAVDTSLHVLTMEPELEKGILRRAAIVLILSFVRALHSAREAGRRLGFGLTTQSQEDIVRILQYVAATDEDGLVKQHAEDVVESLENWQLASLLPPAAGPDAAAAAGPFGGLATLAGLSIHPAGLDASAVASPPSSDAASRPRPRIEEVE